MIKSLLIVLLLAAAGLVFMRHSVPGGEEKKFFGGSVSLLIARNEADTRAFQRWAALNDPASVFGYNSEGIFTRSVARRKTLQLPVVRSGLTETPESVLYHSVKIGIPRLEMGEIRRSPGRLAKVTTPEMTPFLSGGTPVFDEKGNVLCRLDSLPPTGMINVLLLKCTSDVTGRSFQVIESSGDRKFDESAVSELEKISAGGREFTGMLALWPESRGGNK